MTAREPIAPPLRFLTPAELRATAPAEPDWLLEGFIACGVLTVGPAGKPKVGKSTLALALVRAIRSDAGSFLGRRIRSTRVVYLSEESGTTLLHKLPADDPGLHLLTRENAWPRPPWADVVAAATEHAVKVGAELLVVDTFPFWSELPADREKDAGAVQGAVAPLLQATAQGLAVMLPTHTRKAGGEDGDAIRGSNALAGAGDIVLELERPTGENAPPRQRVLAALSRFPQTPPVLLIDHDAATDSWGVIGEGQDRRDTRAASDRAALLRLLPADGPGLTRSELEAEMASPHKQFAGTLNTLVEEGVAHQDGAGRKGDPYRWRLLRTDSAQPPAHHSRSTPELSGALPVGKHQKTESILRSLPDCAESDRPVAAHIPDNERESGGAPNGGADDPEVLDWAERLLARHADVAAEGTA